MSRIDDWFNIPLIEEEHQIELGELRIYATLEMDHYGVPFYTVTKYELHSAGESNGTRFDYGIYKPTRLDTRIDLMALEYWTPERMQEIFSEHDAGLDHQLKIAKEVRGEAQAYHESVL